MIVNHYAHHLQIMPNCKQTNIHFQKTNVQFRLNYCWKSSTYSLNWSKSSVQWSFCSKQVIKIQNTQENRDKGHKTPFYCKKHMKHLTALSQTSSIRCVRWLGTVTEAVTQNWFCHSLTNSMTYWELKGTEVWKCWLAIPFLKGISAVVQIWTFLTLLKPKAFRWNMRGKCLMKVRDIL